MHVHRHIMRHASPQVGRERGGGACGEGHGGGLSPVRENPPDDNPLGLDSHAYGRGVGKRAEADLTLYTLGSPQHVSLRLSMPRWGMRGA